VSGSRRLTRTAHRLFRLCLAGGELDERCVRLVLHHVVASNRRHAVRLLAAFARLVRLHRDRRTAVVESAAPLGRDVQDDVRASLVRVYGRTLDTSFTDNPALIGGIRIKVGSDVYDGSVRARLAAIEARL
jgi:F-type H+-transporting ATPase subunit delta